MFEASSVWELEIEAERRYQLGWLRL